MPGGARAHIALTTVRALPLTLEARSSNPVAHACATPTIIGVTRPPPWAPRSSFASSTEIAGSRQCIWGLLLAIKGDATCADSGSSIVAGFTPRQGISLAPGSGCLTIVTSFARKACLGSPVETLG